MKTLETKNTKRVFSKMNSLFLLIAFALNSLSAQSPQKMTYQSVVRDASGNLITNTAVGIQISIVQGTPTGTNVYTETYTPNPETNINGLVSLEIGSGIPSTGVFANIDWGNSPYFLRAGIDPTGGTNYTVTGTSELLSVPYALYAETSGNAVANGSWSLSGNTGSDPTTDFIGTTDIQPLKFRVENESFGQLNKSLGSVFFGEQAGLNSAGIDNVGIGQRALKDNTAGFNNIGIGSSVLVNNAGAYNIGIGSFTLRDNTTGNRNIGMGHLALRDNTTGSDNIGIGSNTLLNNITGNDNIGMGSGALESNLDGNNNIGMGNGALIANVRGSDNIGVGNQSLADNSNGNNNIGMGNGALSSNTTSSNNIGIGYLVLTSNTVGYNNIGIGSETLTANISGWDNIGLGEQALSSNTTGADNIGIGNQALSSNTLGENNIGLGNEALEGNTTGNENIGLGHQALTANTTGTNNIAMGEGALLNLTTGNANIGIATGALASQTLGDNNIGIGADAQVADLTGSNQVRIGNNQITLAQIQVDWSITSDKKWKEQIRTLPYGLDFVSQLKPVDYIRKNNEAETREIGFIAQDLEKLLTTVGYGDQGFLSKDSKGNLSLRYNDFIPLLTKAIQELDAHNKVLQNMNSELVKRVEKLEQRK